MKLLILNGPNINLLGSRETEFYGDVVLGDIEKELGELARRLEVELLTFQSNCEGRLVDYLQETGRDIDGIVINPASLTKSGYSLLEVLLHFKKPFVEVHMSNIDARGGWHAESIFAANALGRISGFKKESYLLGLRALADYLKRGRQ